LASSQWLQEPTVLPAMILGLATVAIPFFVALGVPPQRKR